MPRNNRKICYTFVVLSFVLTGCASHSGVVATGADTYFLSRQAATGFTGIGTLKAEAFAEAGEFCARQKKTAQVISEKDAEPPFVLGNYPKTEIRFRCAEVQS